VQTTIPFKDQPTSEEAVTAVVDALAHALAAQLHAGPWEPAQISHTWEPNAYEWQTTHNAMLKREAMWLCVTYSFGGSGRDGGGSFSITVHESGRYVLEAYHSGAQWCVSQGEQAAIEALRRACQAVR
jgi:hypothetical protein